MIFLEVTKEEELERKNKRRKLNDNSESSEEYIKIRLPPKKLQKGKKAKKGNKKKESKGKVEKTNEFGLSDQTMKVLRSVMSGN